MTLTAEEYSNVIAKIQFLENKSERLEREKKESVTVLEAIKYNVTLNKDRGTTLNAQEMQSILNLINSLNL